MDFHYLHKTTEFILKELIHDEVYAAARTSARIGGGVGVSVSFSFFGILAADLPFAAYNLPARRFGSSNVFCYFWLLHCSSRKQHRAQGTAHIAISQSTSPPHFSVLLVFHCGCHRPAIYY